MKIIPIIMRIISPIKVSYETKFVITKYQDSTKIIVKKVKSTEQSIVNSIRESQFNLRNETFIISLSLLIMSLNIIEGGLDSGVSFGI